METSYLREVALHRPLPDDAYVARIPVVRYLAQGHCLPFVQGVTFLVGENGTGKSTLLEAIAVACGFNAEGGSRNFTFSTRRTHSCLCDYLTVARSGYPRDGYFLRAESFYNVASNIDELDEAPAAAPLLRESYGGKSLHEQSHGESFFSLMQHRFGAEGLYLLDEPEAALSPSRQMALLTRMNELVKNRSQFVIATHSPILMTFPGARIYELTETGVNCVTYAQTEHYQLTRRFLENPEKMLQYLLET